MERTELESRIAKKQADIERTKRTMNKLISQFNFTEEDQDFAKTNSWKALTEYAEANWPGAWVRGAGDRQDPEKREAFYDLHRKYSTLAEQEVQLQKYNNQLVLVKAEEEKKATTKKIPAIVRYLEWLRGKWAEKIERDIKVYEDRVLSKYDEYLKTGWSYCYDNGLEYDRAAENQAYKEYRATDRKYSQLLDRDVLLYYNRNARTFDWDKCNKELDKDIESLYWDLVDRVTEQVGEIIDASDLSIGAKGNLNGIIAGTKGKVYVETIPAGGYNIQRFHYRTIIKPVKSV